MQSEKSLNEGRCSRVGRGRPARRVREAEAGGAAEPQIRLQNWRKIEEQGVVLASVIPCEIKGEGVRKTSNSPGGPLHPLKDLERWNETRGCWVRFPGSLQVGPWAWGVAALQLYESRPHLLGHLLPQLVPPWGHRSGSLWISGPGPGRGMGGVSQMVAFGAGTPALGSQLPVCVGLNSPSPSWNVGVLEFSQSHPGR